MINEIEIKNFRAFEHTRIKGFGAVNLIGGENNVGKTALLEALLLLFQPKPEVILSFYKYRKEAEHLLEKAPENLWDYLFYLRNKKEKVEISMPDFYNFIEGRSPYKGVTISTSFLSLSLEAEFLNHRGEVFFSGTANIKVEQDNNDKNTIKDWNKDFILPYITTSYRMSNDDLVHLYTQVLKLKQLKTVTNILKKIDKNLANLTLDGTGGRSVLGVLREDEEMIPLGMFGDAVRKATEILFLALTTDSKAIFIDEIENGLHHTKQADVWAALFAIAKERSIQVFATTHSKEMIESFARIGGLAENEGQGVYFEMYRSPQSGQIVAAPTIMETLNDKLGRKRALRGEISA
jgi:AAA15 family ATPase/GTPase